ncbi:MAG: cohesin domain-containing protein [bacterium]|nr:cohesin domain-containing protein [bacterium]
MYFFRRDFERVFLALFVVLGFVFSFHNVAEAQNGSLYFSPSSGTVSAEQSFSIVVRVNTGGTAINAAEGSIVFDPAKLSVSSISKSGSIFTIWAAEPKFSNAEGSIEFAGGVPSPGYSGANGLVLTITFKAKTATTVRGSTEINLVSGGILANDGYGTNILASLGKASYVVSPGVIQPVPPPGEQQKAPVTGSGLVSMEINSPTHPEESKWYSNKNPLFKWNVPSGVIEVILVLSRRANTSPIINYSPPISEKLLDDLDEGEWYLNARLRTAAGLGPTTSFKFNIDTQSPSSFTISRLDTDDLTNPRPQLLFESSDAISGIDRYEMKIGSGDWFKIEASEAGKAYTLPLQKYGERLVEIKAFDKAGNSASSNIEVIVSPVPIPKPIIKEIILPGIEADEVVIIREEKEVVVKEVVVKGKIEKEVVIKEGTVVKVVATVVDVFKLRNGNVLGQISESLKRDELDLIKTIEAPVDENGDFEAKIDDLGVGTYIIRAYGKDERGVVSDAFSDVVLKVVEKSALTQLGESVSNIIPRGFDSLVNFLSKGWFLIVVGAAIASLAILVAKRAIPFIVDETRKIKFIASEYQASKKLKKLDSKTKLELKILEKDIKKELEILNKIASHRSLHQDEQYLRNKLEKYYSLLRKL